MMHCGERDSQAGHGDIMHVLYGPGFAGIVLYGCLTPTMAGLERRIVGGTGEKLMNSLAIRNVVPQKAANYALSAGKAGSASFLKKRRPARGRKKLLFAGGRVSVGVKHPASEFAASFTPVMAGHQPVMAPPRLVIASGETGPDQAAQGDTARAPKSQNSKSFLRLFFKKAALSSLNLDVTA